MAEAMDVHPPVDIGTDFLGYRIEELIGRGGMGVVYRAYDLRLKRPVALKLVAPSLALDERFRERFARETELVMSLEHPNVVPIYDAGDVDGRVYLAMRLVDGTDLGSLLRAEGALEPARAMAICAQIASALDAAHASGLVHRDVKPSNVLLDRLRARLPRGLRSHAAPRRPDGRSRRRPLDRHACLPRARAARRSSGRRPRGRLLPRLPALRMPHRRTGLSPWLAARGGLGAPRGGATPGEPETAQPTRGGRPGDLAGDGEGTRGALSDLRQHWSPPQRAPWACAGRHALAGVRLWPSPQSSLRSPRRLSSRSWCAAAGGRLHRPALTTTRSCASTLARMPCSA